MGWKDLFKRLASGNVSPAPLRATTCSSASLTIKPVLATPTSDDQNILQRLEMSPDKVAQARSVAEQAISSIDSLLEERKRRQTHDNELRSYESMPAVSRPNASPLHGGVPYMSPSSVDASAASKLTYYQLSYPGSFWMRCHDFYTSSTTSFMCSLCKCWDVEELYS